MPDKRRELIRCEELEVGYGGKAILPPVDMTVSEGEFWAVLGRNGSGKSTLFRSILGLLPPVAGRVRHGVSDLRLSYVPQRSSLDDLFPLLAQEVVRMGCDRGRSFLLPSLRQPAAVAQALEQVGASDLAARPFRALSEGQKQRVLLARLAASRPQVALLDEPTAAMDVVAEREALGFLNELRLREGTTIVVVSHYLRVAGEFADHAIFLDREAGTVIEGTPEEVCRNSAFGRRYGAAAVEECSHG